MMNAAGTSALGFVFWMLATRLYDPDEIGVGASLINIMTLLSFLSVFGIQIGLLRFIPQKKKKESHALLNSAISIVIVSSVLFGLGFVLTVNLWSSSFNSVLDGTMEKLAFTLFVTCWSLHLLLNSIFIAKKRSIFVVIKDSGLFSGFKIAFLFFLIGFGAFGLFLSWGFAILIGVLLSWIFVLYRIMDGYIFKPIRLNPELVNIINYTLTNYFGEIFRILPTMVLPIIAVHIISPDHGGYFYITWMIANVIFIMVYMLTLPLVVEGAENIKEIKMKLKKTINLAMLVIGPAIIVLILFPDLILQVVGGDRGYGEGAVLLRVLAISTIPFIYNNIQVALSRIYQDRDVLWLFGFPALFTVIFSVWSFGEMGIVGGGWVWLIGQTIIAVAFVIRNLFRTKGRISIIS
jgi:O-antigen/teichoic acid export membrane protein